MKSSTISYSTDNLTSDQMGKMVEEVINDMKQLRGILEKRWYDNNFFDDGFHFRFFSRSQNKIIDLSERSTFYNPIRAIPKASRQIRGITNLLISKEPTPIIYPKRVDITKYPSLTDIDPQTQQPVQIENPQYRQEFEQSKQIAKRVGFWMEEEFKNQDLMEKLSYMIHLSLKQGISFLQIWPESKKEGIKTQVFEAFDIFLHGQYLNLDDCPFIIKAVPKTISDIKNNPFFDKTQTDKIQPDNRYSSSEIKEAYMLSRYGKKSNSDYSATLLLKEMFIKEHINTNNKSRIKKQEDGAEIIKQSEEGDIIIRHNFSVAGISLYDEYLNMNTYPFAEFRMEPGALYQTPMIERFIPSNKSLDMVVSRIERYIHTMVTGAWMKAKSEGNLNIQNTAGGQIIEYTAIPPIQANLAPIPAFVPQFIQMMTSFIEEQGVTTSTLGKLPSGVKANAAIESLKESEYANLVVAQSRLQKTLVRIGEKMIDVADTYFVSPQSVYRMERGNPDYFQVIGESNLKAREKLKIGIDEGVIPISKHYKVNFEIQAGVAYTREGKKAAMQQLIGELRNFAVEGYIPPQAIKIIIEKYLEYYQFGATAEFMEAMDNYQSEGNLTQQQMESIKTALAEVFKDLQSAGIFPTSDQRIKETQVGVVQAVKDLQPQGGEL